MKVTIVIGIFLAIFVGLFVTFSYVQEDARESLENGNYCEAYQVVKWSSMVSRDAKQMLGFLFAGGLCVD